MLTMLTCYVNHVDMWLTKKGKNWTLANYRESTPSTKHVVNMLSVLTMFTMLTLGRTSKLIPPPSYKEGGGWNPSLDFSFY